VRERETSFDYNTGFGRGIVRNRGHEIDEYRDMKGRLTRVFAVISAREASEPLNLAIVMTICPFLS
jgi:hypothetical protein